jgi:hypothetical protein
MSSTIKVRERLAVNEQKSHRCNLEGLSLKKLKEGDTKGKCCTEVSNMFAALEDLEAEVEVNSAWEMIRENLKI